jgi:hypothetical protein
MNAREHELAHAIVMSMLRDVVITPTHGLSSPYQATVNIAKNSWPTVGHPYTVTCQGSTPLDATWNLYVALRQWCHDPTSDLLTASTVLRAGPTPQVEPNPSDAAKRGGQ